MTTQHENMTTGMTPGVGSWEGRLAEDGWCLFLETRKAGREVIFKLSWIEVFDALIMRDLIAHESIC